jgi:hypothetical protein
MSKKFCVGDVVDLTRWDRSERPTNRLGQCVITAMRRAQCESGWLCDVQSITYPGTINSGLDQHWFRLIQRGDGFRVLPSNEQDGMVAALAALCACERQREDQSHESGRKKDLP